MRTASFVTRLLRDESGATAVEYGLLLTLLILAVAGAMTLVGQNIASRFNYLAARFAGN